MCGIVGFTGHHQAAPILLSSLERLEYRGYDSAGLCVRSGSAPAEVVKATGKLRNLAEKTDEGRALSGDCGIGHTRWATHGNPSEANAHPHVSGNCTGTGAGEVESMVVGVHNGIIENYEELREKLVRHGYRFYSSTDTEVAIKLVDYYYRKYQIGPVDAINRTMVRVRGSYALALMFSDYPGEIYAARKDSPMIIGTAGGETFLGSDVPAILKYTRQVYYIGNLEVARLLPGEVTFFDLNGDEVDRESVEITWDAEAAEKGGFEHFMIKEIHEQPSAVRDTLNSVLKETEALESEAGDEGTADTQFDARRKTEAKAEGMEDAEPAAEKKRKTKAPAADSQEGAEAVGRETVIDLSKTGLSDERIRAISDMVIVACGSAWHVGMAGQYIFEDMARIPVRVELASEFRYRTKLLSENTLVVLISQSGETADTLAALREAKEQGARTLAIVNVVGSSIAREADHVFYTLAGPEIAVATTKAYSAQLMAVYALAVQFAFVRGAISREAYRSYIQELLTIPDKIARVIEDKERIQWFAAKFAAAKDVFFLGRGLDYAICLEGGLKMKEISYIHSEAYAAGEMKHGTISLIEEGILVIGVLTQSDLCEKTISNMVECKARGAYLMGLTSYGHYNVEDTVNFCVYVPLTDAHFMASLAVVPLQLLGYYLSVARGLDVDKPRNLAKSVTVE